MKIHWIVSYPDALVKASTSNKPGVGAELHIIDKLLMSCIVAQLNIWIFANLSMLSSSSVPTCHPGHRCLFTAWLPEEKCEVVTAGHQHLLTYHLTIMISYSETYLSTRVTFMTEL